MVLKFRIRPGLLATMKCFHGLFQTKSCFANNLYYFRVVFREHVYILVEGGQFLRSGNPDDGLGGRMSGILVLRVKRGY